MERLRIEERFFANFEAVPDCSDGNESYESLRSVSSYNSELVVSDFTASLTPSPNTSCGSGHFPSSSSIGHECGRERQAFSEDERFARSSSADTHLTFGKVKDKKKSIMRQTN